MVQMDMLLIFGTGLANGDSAHPWHRIRIPVVLVLRNNATTLLKSMHTQPAFLQEEEQTGHRPRWVDDVHVHHDEL
jgi:hypothetical protein